MTTLEVGERTSRRPLPHLVLDPDELVEIRDGMMDADAFVIDLETNIPEGSGKALRNDVLWIGLGTRGQVHLIPTGHPKGVTIMGEHKAKRPAFTHYELIGEPDNPKRWTPATRDLPMDQRKASWAQTEYTVPATYGPKPDQMEASTAFDILRPLMFSDIPKIGHNVKFDLMSSAKYYDGVIPPGPYHDTIILTHVLDEWRMSYDLKSLITSWMGIGRNAQFPVVHHSEKGGFCNRCAAPIPPGGVIFKHVDGKGGGTTKFGNGPGEWWCEKCAGMTEQQWHERGGNQTKKDFYPNLGKNIQEHGIEVAARYLAKDVHYDWLFYQRQIAKLHQAGLVSAYSFEMDLYPVLMDIESQGFPVDESIKDAKGDLLKEDIAELETKIFNFAGDEFPMSNTDTRRYLLFGEGNGYGKRKKKLNSENLKVWRRTPKDNKPVLTQGVLEALAIESEVAQWFYDWSKLEKLRGTFIDGLDQWLVRSDDGQSRIHTSFKQHGTVTSRLSAHEPNLHQLPRGSAIREFFIAGAGYQLIVSDYDQVELRVMADLAEDEAMIQIFQEGRDIHREAAAAMLQKNADDITDDERQLGKGFNFSTGYGATEKKLAAMAGTTEEKAAEFIERYYDNFNRLLPWKRKVLKEAWKRGDSTQPTKVPPYVEIPPFGRQRRLPDLFSTLKWARLRAERQAINAVVQGFAANITKIAMIDLHYGLDPEKAKMLVQVHDEIVFRTVEDAVDEVMPQVVSTMEGVLNPVTGQPILKHVPLVASAKAGPSWAAAK